MIAPAQSEGVASLFDRNGFPPGPPRAVVLGQYQMIEIDRVPVFGERLAVARIGRGCLMVSCLA
jgi:hypothetical protein